MHYLQKLDYIQSVEPKGEVLLIQSGEDISGRLVKDLVKGEFVPTYLHQTSNDLDEIYSRYFEKAGEQHAANGKDRKLPWKKRD